MSTRRWLIALALPVAVIMAGAMPAGAIVPGPVVPPAPHGEYVDVLGAVGTCPSFTSLGVCTYIETDLIFESGKLIDMLVETDTTNIALDSGGAPVTTYLEEMQCRDLPSTDARVLDHDQGVTLRMEINAKDCITNLGPTLHEDLTQRFVRNSTPYLTGVGIAYYQAATATRVDPRHGPRQTFRPFFPTNFNVFASTLPRRGRY